MTVEPPWVKSGQAGWEERADNRQHPLWLRISCLAYARVKANGCAEFQPGELARRFGKHRQAINTAITTAIEYRWLDETSCTECLRPPGLFIEMDLGSKYAKCRIHGGVKERSKSARQKCSSQPRDETLSISDVNTECLHSRTLSVYTPA